MTTRGARASGRQFLGGFGRKLRPVNVSSLQPYEPLLCERAYFRVFVRSRTRLVGNLRGCGALDDFEDTLKEQERLEIVVIAEYHDLQAVVGERCIVRNEPRIRPRVVDHS